VCEQLRKAVIGDEYVMIETDFSRYDGTLCRPVRNFEKALYRSAYPNDPLPVKLHNYCHHLKVSVREPSKELERLMSLFTFNTQFARASGEPGTCYFNSMINMMFWFSVLGRNAFENVIVGGDDGIAIVRLSPIPVIEDFAKKFGLVLKCKVVRPGEPIGFLGRYFNWGTINSVCDPIRTATKIHIASAVVPECYAVARYVEKLRSLLENDANTPIIGQYLREQFDCAQRKLNDLKKRFQKLPPSLLERDWRLKCEVPVGPYPNALEDWMNDFISTRVRRNGELLEILN
jgi:hypothetical protein